MWIHVRVKGMPRLSELLLPIIKRVRALKALERAARSRWELKVGQSNLLADKTINLRISQSKSPPRRRLRRSNLLLQSQLRSLWRRLLRRRLRKQNLSLSKKLQRRQLLLRHQLNAAVNVKDERVGSHKSSTWTTNYLLSVKSVLKLTYFAIFFPLFY